jgi:DNA-directed RNA polymerase subunit M/transcription elongation factor TFIIS
MQFCPHCRNYLYLNAPEDRARREGAGDVGELDADKLMRICRTCGFQEEDKRGGLVLETNLQEKTSEGYKILLNEFTKQDPTLPHVDTIKCPSASCKSNEDVTKRDVIYLKYDPINMKFLYICNVCNTQWKSKGS